MTFRPLRCCISALPGVHHAEQDGPQHGQGKDCADQRIPRHPSVEEGDGTGKRDSDCRCRQDLQQNGIGPAQRLDGLPVLFLFAVPADTGRLQYEKQDGKQEDRILDRIIVVVPILSRPHPIVGGNKSRINDLRPHQFFQGNFFLHDFIPPV